MGTFLCIFLVIERIGLRKLLKIFPKWIRHTYAILVIMFGWIFFRADSLRSAINYICGMFRLSGEDVINFNFIMKKQYWLCLLLGIFFVIPHIQVKEFISMSRSGTIALDICILFSFFIAICYMVGSGFSPFLYFRF